MLWHFLKYFRFKRKFIIFPFLLGLLLLHLSSLNFSDSLFDLSHISTNFDNPITNVLLPPETLLISKESTNDLLPPIGSSLFRKLSSAQLSNLNCPLSHSFTYNYTKIEITPEYLKRRENGHFYDPRITLSVYLNELKERYANNEDSLPFSWEDWVDLSYLNIYLGDQKITCEEFYTTHKITKSSKSANKGYYCIDDSEFLKSEKGKFKNPMLLPGFNFKTRIDMPSNFVSKTFNAKSFLLSYAEAPKFIYFLNENGTFYRTKTHMSKPMTENGLIEKFLAAENNLYDPVSELKSINSKFLLSADKSFKKVLTQSSKFELNIPKSNFELNPLKQFKSLYDMRENLEQYETDFIESLEHSMKMDPMAVPKYFKEVNLVWPATYNGHKLVENGGHYDARFFSGLISETPNSDFCSYSPWYSSEVDNAYFTPTTRKDSILSHLLHTLLSLTFHNGWFMFPAHGSLLSWYFTATTFPWDSDGDVQMPIADLAEFCLRFNNSMIVQNPKYGVSKYYVDCTSTLTHRIKANGNNNIDARVIDVDSGLFVDITGLSVSGEPLSSKNWASIDDWLPKNVKKEYPVFVTSKAHKPPHFRPINDIPRNNVPVRDSNLEKKVLDVHRKYDVYNCRNKHYYTHDQLSPVRLTMFEGAPTFVAASKRSIRAQLESEYKPSSLTSPAWDQWLFSKYLRLWVNAEDVYHILKDNDIEIFKKTRKGKKKLQSVQNIKASRILPAFLKNEAFVTSELIKMSVYELTKDTMLKSERKLKYNVIDRIYHDYEATSVHSREMCIFNSQWEWKTPKMRDFATYVPDDWLDLASWILKDHAPPKPSILSYLTCSDKGRENTYSD